MDTRSVPQRTRTQETKTTRAERGHRLAFERFEEIVMLRPAVYVVPACSGDHAYIADLKRDTCSCEDAIFGENFCKHLHAAQIVHAKMGTCPGCRSRQRRREMIEVPDDSNIAWFEGDVICRSCAERDAVMF